MNKEKMFSFPLIEKKKSISYIILLIIWNLGCACGLFSVFFKDDIKSVFLGTFLISFVIWIIGNLFVKKYKIVGNFELNTNTIKVSKESDILYFDVIRTNGLILKYYGAKGDSFGAYAGLLRIKDGSGNIVSFEYDGQPYKFEFLVIKQSFLFSIYWLLRAWKNLNVDFKILNQNKKDITIKVLKEGWH